MEFLYYDRHLAVAIKEPGILSQKDDRGRDNLPDRIQRELGGEIFPVHRLDRETGGVMVFARSEKAAAALSRNFQEREMKKEYLAVLTATPFEKEGRMEDLLFFDRQKNKVFPVKRERKGVKKALLSYRVLEEENGLCLVRVFPETGRTHQIRVQFSSRKMPLYGDRKYGGAGESLGLFCQVIGFHHPESGEWMEFSATPPKDKPWNGFQLI